MKRTVTIAMTLTAALLFGCAQQFGGVKSMRGADVAAADKAQQEAKYLGGRPGTQQPIARTFEQQPPLIPHATDNFDEITLDENQCMTCHSAEKYIEKKATKVGDSHFVMVNGKASNQLSMDRYACVNCHVPQVDAKPLVDNHFVGHLKKN
jgi:nitrate reductase (cytochrome), electron transfer subunit